MEALDDPSLDQRGRCSLKQHHFTWPPIDCWVVACSLADRSVNGELGRTSEPIRPLLTQIIEAPLNDRGRIWQEYIDGLDERDGEALVEAVASINPDDPAPEAEWLPPILGETVEALPFPTSVFPEPLAKHCRDVAAALKCSVDYFCAAVIAVAASAIGLTVRLGLRRGWQEAAQFYVAQVGPPGWIKSPALKLAMDPLLKIESELREARRELMAAHEEQKKSQPATAALAPPPATRIVVSDITRESLCLIHYENPRGLLVHHDELAAWISSMNQYKNKGSDRQFWLSVWAGVSVTVDRKAGRESLHIPHPLLNVVGGLVPEMLWSFRDERGRDDGFLDRILFAYPSHAPSQLWTEDQVSQNGIDDWSKAIRWLWSRKMEATKDRREQPHFVALTPAAKQIWIGWWDRHVAESEEPDFPEHLRGPWVKFRSHLARLALMLAMLHRAYDPTSEASAFPNVDVREIRGAILLVDYFKRSYRRVKAEIDGGTIRLPDDVQSILKWTARNDRSRFSEAEVNRGLGRFRGDPERLTEALDWLVKHRCIRPEPAPPREGPGRPASPTFQVNSRLKRAPYSFNSRNGPPDPQFSELSEYGARCQSENSERGDSWE
jgi:Protein of unknown function (DUF3987)